MPKRATLIVPMKAMSRTFCAHTEKGPAQLTHVARLHIKGGGHTFFVFVQPYNQLKRIRPKPVAAVAIDETDDAGKGMI
jgi:hypothetical protein